MKCIKITYKYETSVKKYLEENGEHFRELIDLQVEGKTNDDDKLTVFEFETTSSWEFTKPSKSN